jgi:hypothetical protein
VCTAASTGSRDLLGLPWCAGVARAIRSIKQVAALLGRSTTVMTQQRAAQPERSLPFRPEHHPNVATQSRIVMIKSTQGFSEWYSREAVQEISNR